MEEVLKSEIQEIKRPWQANVWIGLNIISIFLICIVVFFLIPYGDKAGLFATFFPILVFFELLLSSLIHFVYGKYCLCEGGISLFSVILILMLNISLIKGFIKSSKNLIIVALFLSFLRVAVMFYVLVFLIKSNIVFGFLISIILSLPNLYLEYSCLKHPFYNKKVN